MNETAHRTRISADTSVADIVGAHPELKPVLRTVGIDLCCGGSLTLREAAEVRGAAVDDIIDALDRELVPRPAAVTPTPALATPTLTVSASTQRIKAEDSVRAVIAKFPATVVVFEAHGLMGCGGAAGPDERIDFFANVHRIAAPKLLGALNDAAAKPAPPPAPATSAAAESAALYRPFLLAALVLTVTLGALLGAHNLLALHAGTVPFRPALNPIHGGAQVWGFVFLFIIGVAYHAFPRFVGADLRPRALARASLGLTLVGITLSTIGRLALPPPIASTVGLFGAISTLAATAAFAYVLAATWRAAKPAPDSFHRFLAAGTFWWLVAAALLVAQSARAIAMAGNTAGEINEAIYTAALLGGALLWVQGMFLRIGPVFLNLAKTRTALAHATFFITNAGVFLAVAGLAAPTFPTSHVVASIGLLFIAFSVPTFIAAVRPWSGDSRHFFDGNRVFVRVIRLAFAAAVLFAVLAGVAAVTTLANGYASRFLYDGARHAFGLGFVTLMIFGVAARILPIFGGVPLAYPRALALGTALIAIGVVLREAQVLVAILGEPSLLKVSAISGIPAALGVLLAGASVFATLRRSSASRKSEAAPRFTAISPDANVAALIASHPEALPILIESGFTPLANPLLRRTLAHAVSLRQACRMHGIDVDAVVVRIKSACQHVDEVVRPAVSASVPLVSLSIKGPTRSLPHDAPVR